jgi:hypothetical protein
MVILTPSWLWERPSIDVRQRERPDGVDLHNGLPAGDAQAPRSRAAVPAAIGSVGGEGEGEGEGLTRGKLARPFPDMNPTNGEQPQPTLCHLTGA